MAIAPINNSAVAMSTTGTTGNTVGFDSTGSDLLILHIGSLNGTPITIANFSDSFGNTWTASTARNGGSAWLSQFWWCQPPANKVGASHTAVATLVGSFPSIQLLAFSGSKASDSLDTFTEANTYAGFSAATSVAVGAVIPSQGAELVLWALSGGVAATISGTTGTLAARAVAGNGAANAVYYQIQTLYASRNQTFSWAGAQQGATNAISFRSTSGGTPNGRLIGGAGKIVNYTSTPNLIYEYTQAYSVRFTLSKTRGNGALGVIYTTVPNDGVYAGHETFIADVDGSHLCRLWVRLIHSQTGPQWISVYGSTQLDDGLQHVIWITYDGSGTAAGVKVYVDSVADTMTTDTNGDTLGGLSIIGGAQVLQIANQTGFSYSLSESGEGSVADFFLETVLRDATYVATNSNIYTMPTPGSNTKQWTPARESTGTAVNSISPYGYNGTASSSAVWTGDPATAPSAPTIGTATAVDATDISISFTAGSNGGSTVTSATATTSPGGFTGTSSGGSPITINAAFVAGQAYTVTVTQTNIIGTSSASAASNSVTPKSNSPHGASSNSGSGFNRFGGGLAGPTSRENVAPGGSSNTFN